MHEIFLPVRLYEGLAVHLQTATLCVCHPQHVVQASTRHMLETLNVQSALRIVSAMEKHLLSAAVRKASSGLRKILQLWLVHVSTPEKKKGFKHDRHTVCFDNQINTFRL